MQGQYVAFRCERVEVPARNVWRRRAEWIVSQDPHAERAGEFTDAPPDAPVADDADARTVQVADGHLVTLRPAAFPDEASQRTQPLDEVQCEGKHSLGDGARPAAWRDHNRDAASAGCGKVDEVDPDAGPGHHAQPWRLLEEGVVHHRIGPGDGTDSDSEVVGGRFGQERDATSEDSIDQSRVNCAERHDDGTIGGHSDSPPNVAPGTVGTCSHVPFSAEAAAAAITSATW